MRLTVPEPKIRLYEDGFSGHDQLGRAKTGSKLSDLVERIDDPLVIALDGAWGSGKSFFLKCWVGEHLKRQGNTSQTVYFDAFQHDFLDDPLIALTGAIAERFRDPDAEKQETDQARASARRSKLKKSAWAVSKAAGRIGLSAVTFGATEILSGMGDEIAKAASDEAKAFLSSDAGDDEAEKFWNAHDARIAAMEAFRLALTELTEPDETGHPQRKLVIVIDELDRCRPDYALSLLEIIKHFFNVDGVHFVLGVNLVELQNSVRARYGDRVQAAKYLQKFISILVRLQGPKVGVGNQSAYSKHFDRVADLIGLPNHWPRSFVRDYLVMSNHHFMISLRDVERLACLLQVVPSKEIETLGEKHIFAGLVLMQVIAPHLLETARKDQLEYSAVDQLFLLETRSKSDGPFFDARTAWRLTTFSTTTSLSMSISERGDEIFAGQNRLSIVRNLIGERLDAFELPYAE